jgi:hypothetical protein
MELLGIEPKSQGRASAISPDRIPILSPGGIVS